MLSVLDSVGDYYACARAARVPIPTPEAVNRGILMEGFCSFLSGTVGCGHATTTYGANIGTIGVTKVRYAIFMLVAIYNCLKAYFALNVFSSDFTGYRYIAHWYCKLYCLAVQAGFYWDVRGRDICSIPSREERFFFTHA